MWSRSQARGPLAKLQINELQIQKFGFEVSRFEEKLLQSRGYRRWLAL
jgi:hypothetical protein